MLPEIFPSPVFTWFPASLMHSPNLLFPRLFQIGHALRRNKTPVSDRVPMEVISE
jgi:hypothetical protein